MIQRGSMWILDNDDFFGNTFDRTGDEFEQHNLNAALNFVKTFNIALDGGAHYGSWSRNLAKRFNRVLSFEPRDDIYECLDRNTQAFENITTHKKAVGDRMDTVEVGIGKHYDNTGCSTVLGNGSTPLITIDSLGLDELNFLKLDVEGYEYFALQGAVETLTKCKPVVLFEDKGHSNDYGIENGACAKLLESLGATKLSVMSRRDFIYGWI